MHHSFWCIFWRPQHDHDVKLPIVLFYMDRVNKQKRIFFSILKLGNSLKNSALGKFTTFHKMTEAKWTRSTNKVWKNAKAFFQWSFFCCRRSFLNSLLTAVMISAFLSCKSLVTTAISTIFQGLRCGCFTPFCRRRYSKKLLCWFVKLSSHSRGLEFVRASIHTLTWWFRRNFCFCADFQSG